MKPKISNESGGVLLVVLISSMIMGVTLGSYLKFTGTQSRSIQKSQAWNAAIPVAEAGIEEALAHINDSVIGTNFALNGWTVVSNQFERSGTIEGGRYTVRVSPDRFPIITAVGWASGEKGTNEYRRTVRVTTTQYATGMTGLITKGNLVMTGGTSIDSFDSQDPAYNTLGRYDAAKNKDGAYVASVYGNLSAEVIYGSAGTGPTGVATGTIGDEAWVASNTGIQPGKYANDVNLAFPTVDPPWNWGTASSLPGGGTVALTNYYYWSSKITTTNMPSPVPPSGVTINTNGFITLAYPSYPVGVPSWQIVTNIYYDFQQRKSEGDPLPGTYIGSVDRRPGPYLYYNKITGYTYPTLTYTYSLSATNSSKTTNVYTSILNANNGQYEATNLRLNGSEKILVTGTNVTLYIRDDFQMTGAGSEVVIAPGASLKVFVGGDVNLAGNGIFNYNLDASKFSLWGLPTCQNIAISGNASFTGVIYAPDAHITMNGSGTTEYDVVGAITGKSAVLNGHFNFHYDEALSRARIISKYNVASWREI